MATHEDLLQQVGKLATTVSDTGTLMQGICDDLHSAISRYNSISFRLIDQANPGILVLGPYAGSFTPQLRVAYTQGLSGMAASTERTVVVNNVKGDTQYLQASALVKSEIVIPIFARGRFAALLDIQSYFVDTFKEPNDVSFLESCAAVVGKFMEAHS
jgi:L-methionine (R)-S-oxide reductase